MKPALLLIDLQGDYLSARDIQPSARTLISNVTRLLKNCRARNIPVIHVWTTVHRSHDLRMLHWKKKNRWQCVAGTVGHKTPALLKQRKGEPIIHKTGFNAFANPELAATLRKAGCDSIILCGLHLHACVRTAAAEGIERGWQVFIAEDAVASDDPVHAAATRRWLAARCVEFDSVNALLARLDGIRKKNLIHRSPRQNKKILFEVPVAGPHEITKATSAAHRAWEKWRSTKLPERQRLLEDFASRLEKSAQTLSHQMAVEIGKPVSHGLEEIHRAAANVRDVLRRAKQFNFQTKASGGTVRRRPLGVVGLISPWNNPVAIPVGKIAPALIYGNVIVWKSSPAATRISETVLKIWRQCAPPRGLVQLLPGDHTTAQSLATDENINAVTLTSSAPAGFAIQEICARRHLPLQGELSGNNAAIVWHDTDLACAAEQIVRGAFGFAGQRCTANRRVIVSGKIFSKYFSALKLAAEKMNWGDPLQKNTDIGPVINAHKCDEHSSLLLAARNSGLQVELLFESRAQGSWLQTGAYAQPAIVVCDEPGHPVVQEETMSPLLVVQQAKNFSQALELCNGVRHGLVAALFSNSPARRKEFLSQVQAGMLKLNTSTVGADISLPFGGWKSSGIGPPEHGEGDPLFYTRLQAIYE